MTEPNQDPVLRGIEELGPDAIEALKLGLKAEVSRRQEFTCRACGSKQRQTVKVPNIKARQDTARTILEQVVGRPEQRRPESSADASNATVVYHADLFEDGAEEVLTLCVALHEFVDAGGVLSDEVKAAVDAVLPYRGAWVEGQQLPRTHFNATGEIYTGHGSV